MREQLLEFAVTSIVERRRNIEALLYQNHIKYELQVDKSLNVANVIVKLNQTDDPKEKVIVLGAHYDVVRNSSGLNDNGAAILVLIEVIKRLKESKSKVPIEVVFFDREETGMVGSHLYTLKHRDRIDYAVILDIIAFGDRLVYGTHEDRMDLIMGPVENLSKINRVLPSDNSSFNLVGIPSVLIIATPDKDLVKREDGSYGLVANPEFYSSFHNRKNDNNIEVLNFELIKEAIEIIVSLF